MSILDNARAEALFASTFQPSESHTAAEIRLVIAVVFRELHVRGCACRVAAEFGDHPETAAARMSWAIKTVHATYPPRGIHRRNVLSAARSEPAAR